MEAQKTIPWGDVSAMLTLTSLKPEIKRGQVPG